MGLSDKRQESKQSSTSSGTGTSTNRYDFLTPPDSPDIIAARNDRAQIDPSIGYRLGEKERQLNESFDNPMGGYVTPQIRDAIRRSGQRELMQIGGQQTREGAFDANRLNQSKNLALAGMTSPRLVNTGSTTTQQGTSSGTGSVTQSESPLGTALQVGAAAAPLSL